MWFIKWPGIIAGIFITEYKISLVIHIKKHFVYNFGSQTEMFEFVLLAQLVEHVTFNDVADGSNPSQDTIFQLKNIMRW